MPFVVAYQCDVGRDPDRINEDYVWTNDQIGLFIVADGMGGYEAGEVASKMATTSIAKTISSALKSDVQLSSKEQARELLVGAIETANKTVFTAAGQKEQQKQKMGTTIVMALIQSSIAYISHVGDSRAYLARDNDFTQLTVDDSWENEFGNLQPNNKKNRSPIDHILTQSIGREPNVTPSFTEVALTPGDQLFLCTDGLWGMLTDDQILDHLQNTEHPPQKIVDDLVAVANAAGGLDNITAIVIKMG